MNLHDGAIDLIGAIAKGLEQAHGDDDGVVEVLARLGEQDLSPAAMAPAAPRRLPGCRHLPETVALSLMVAPEVSVAIAGVEDQLHWQANPNYSDEAMGQPGYLENYAYANLIGPKGVFPGDDFLMALLVLGPGLHYLDHYHDAPELYWLLTGPSDWKRGAGGYEERRPGETVWHRPLLVHATRTQDVPLLAVAIWTRDVDSHARLVGRGLDPSTSSG